MKSIKIITRADDAGSSRSANLAIQRAISAGFIKNVSLMACCDYIDEAAEFLRGEKEICFGMHATLNAEWDNVKWKPLTGINKGSGLVGEHGYFLAAPSMFLTTKPKVELALKEYDAQLDKLTKLGFNITYVDSHMYAEIFIDGLVDAKREWAARKGLLYHMDYDNPPKISNFENTINNLGKFFCSLPNGQYLYITHPALYSDEMLQTGNTECPGSEVARVRDMEARAVSDPELIMFLNENGVTAIRYDEAKMQKRVKLIRKNLT